MADLRNVLSVDQDAAAFEIEEAQQQIDQGRLAGAGAADQPDLFARLNRERQPIHHGEIAHLPVAADARRAPVAEAHIVERDLAARHVERGRLRCIGERDRACDRHHAFLHHADILEDRGHLIGDPAGHTHDLPGERQRHRNRADLDPALRPQQHREPAGPGDQHRVERRKTEAEQRVEPQRAVKFPGVVFKRLSDVVVFLARAREQLHRQDIRVAVDDTAGQRRTRLGHLLRAVAHARHDRAQQHEIAAEPQCDREREPRVRARQQQQCAGAIDQDVPDARDQSDDGLAQRRARLHDAVGDAAGKVVLEERP